MQMHPKTIQDLIDYVAELVESGQQEAADAISTGLLACPVKNYPGLGFAPAPNFN